MALKVAKQGGTVVVAARRKAALEELVLDCDAAGGHVLAAPVDVTDGQAIEALARLAIETFGRVDVWINNASVTLFGRFEETPASDFRRVIDTNLFGYIQWGTCHPALVPGAGARCAHQCVLRSW